LPTHHDRLHSLLDLAFQVPEILEAVDLAVAGDVRHSEDDLARRLNTQETALSSWLMAHASKATGRTAPRNGIAGSNSGNATTPPSSRNSLFNLTCETLCRICHLLVVESLAEANHDISRSLLLLPSPSACASNLRHAMTTLEEAAGTPICKARVMSAPLHFLSGYYKRHEDDAGLQWCRKTRQALEKQAPYLHWDALLPWCLLTLDEIPHYDADLYA
jgi:hypothetical protein